MFRKFLLISGMAFLLGLGVGLAQAEDSMGSTLEENIRAEIAAAFPGASIEVYGPVRWLRGGEPANTTGVRFLGENGRGEAHVQVRSVIEAQDVASMMVSEGMVPFSASMPTYVAKKRISPGERMTAELFTRQSVDVARGQAREMRGVIFPPAEAIAGLEARQTILEGQFLTTTAVQRTPDLRRGDAVSIRILSGELTVSVPGTAEESAYLDGRVRVMSSKTKRELVGYLKSGSIVEVKL